MSESPYVTPVTRAEFSRRVLDESREVPVLVDFWAPWCGPCRMLSPVLDQLAADYEGKLRVAKVNTDVEQELATEFQIRGIPAVKLFRHGRVVGEFVGVQPAPAIRSLVEPFLPNEADALIEQSATLAHAGKAGEAAALLREAAAHSPQDDRIKIELAKLLVALPPDHDSRARLEECQKLLESLTLRSSTNAEVDKLRTRLDLLRAVVDAPPVEELKRLVRDNADDSAARFQLAARLALAGEFEPAMNQLLAIVERNRSYGDDAGRRALVGLFNLLGNQHPLTSKYRALLSRQLN